MQVKIERFLAIMMLVVPGVAATYGFLMIKNAWFAQFEGVDAGIQWLRLFIGLVLFLSGVFFIAGWVLYRDRKRNYVVPRFQSKDKQDNP